MDQTHHTPQELDEALARYRSALADAREAAPEDSDRDELIAAARTLLDEDDVDAHRLIVALAEGEFGDQVWRLEEELLDDE